MKTEEQKKSNGIVWITLLVMVAVCVWAGSAVFIRGVYPTLEQSGQFGDMFGAINALFSGVALGGVVVAIFYQRSELKLQRKELELTREEMKNQREEMAGQKEHLEGQRKTLDKQYESMLIQQVENSFYQMLKVHSDLNSMMYVYINDDYNKPKVVGNALFEVAYNKMSDECFEEAHNDYNEQIIPYLFRIQTILKFIDESAIENKGLYVDLLRSNCTSCEMKVIEAYLTEPMGFHRLNRLVERYSLLSRLAYK